MLKSKRFWFGILGLMGYVLIAIQYAKVGMTVDFMGLGIGIGLALTPAAAATAIGHYASKSK